MYPYWELISLFLIIAGLIIGLGAVTVIDLHGFLARNSSYWTESTIRTHKVTKPLIWLGIILYVIGLCLFYKDVIWAEITIIQFVIAAVLILNGIFLSFYISPQLLERERQGKIAEVLPQSLQNKITISFLISFAGWWGSVLILVSRLVMFYK